MLEKLLTPIVSAQFLTLALLAILFLQSGIDKILDFKGNLAWLKGHFAKSPLAGQVAPMLGVITLTETAAGALAAVGAVMLRNGMTMRTSAESCQQQHRQQQHLRFTSATS